MHKAINGNIQALIYCLVINIALPSLRTSKHLKVHLIEAESGRDNIVSSKPVQLISLIESKDLLAVLLQKATPRILCFILLRTLASYRTLKVRCIKSAIR